MNNQIQKFLQEAKIKQSLFSITIGTASLFFNGKELTLMDKFSGDTLVTSTDPDLISQFQSLFTDERAKSAIEELEKIRFDRDVDISDAISIIKKHFGLQE